MKIIAESACNHNGEIKYLKNLALKSKESGVDYFTVQIFRTDSFCTSKYSKLDIYKSLELSDDEWGELFLYCKNINMPLIPCVLDEKSFQLCYEHGYRFFKIHGTDITNISFLDIIKQKKCKIIIETQCATLFEINFMMSKYEDIVEAIFLGYSNYPTEIEDFNINSISSIKKYKCKKGYADHSRDIVKTPLLLLGKGYDYIEKHITISRNDRGYDWQVSLYPEELKIMVSTLKHYKKALGINRKHPCVNETKYRDVMYKKFINGNMIRSDKGLCYIPHILSTFPLDSIGVAIIARLKSKRLHKKCLISFPDKPMITTLFERIKTCRNIEDVSVVTSDLVDDKKLVDMFPDNSFTGDADSVVDRMLQYAFTKKLGYVFRVTGDNPFTDPILMDMMTDMVLKNDLDYVRAIGFPFGISAEIFKTTYLWDLYLKINNPDCSEYLSWYVLKDKTCKKGCIKLDHPLNKTVNIEMVNLSVDYIQDLDRCKKVYNLIGKPSYDYIYTKDIINICDKIDHEDANKKIKLPNSESISLQKYLNFHNTSQYSIIKKINNISVFTPFKDKHKGEVAYLIGSGPSVKDFKEQEQGVYIGMNFSYLNQTVNKNLTYLFTEGYDNKKGNLSDDVIFFYYNQVYNVDRVPYRNPKNTYKYTDTDIREEVGAKVYYNKCNISSMAFHTLFFALYCGFTKIYLVGCDCTKGYFFKDFDTKYHKNASKTNFGILVSGWKLIKQLSPTEINITSINPKNLKGIFNDIYTTE